MGLFKRFKAPKATISITLDKATFNQKELMTGTISVTSSDEFEADEIRIEIEVTEETRATGTPVQRFGTGERKIVTVQQSANLHKEKTTVAGRMKITKGFKEGFPFSIPIPSGVPPTYHGRNANNTWRLKGVIAVKGRPDVTGHPTEVTITL